MLQLMKKIIVKLKLILIYFRRILFAKNHFKCSFWTKIKANLSGGFLADQWVLYDLDHNDKNEYLSEFDWYRSRYINDPFEFVLNNKVVAAEVLKQYVRVPETYLIKNKGFLSSFRKDIKDYTDIPPLLREQKKLFIKPHSAGKGTGVFIFIYEDGKYFIDKKEVSEEELIQFMKKRDNWLICEMMVQHEYSDQLYDKTTNTIRLITLRDIHTKEFKVFFAVQRIGTKDTIPVDNGSRGGLVAKIDLDTGTLSVGRCLHNKNVYKVHPDSNNPIEGAIIPNWDKIKKEILELANNMPYMHFIAWDILITNKNEMSIIEANTSSGVNIIQLWGGQRNNELGDFYRYHKVIKK